MSLTHLIRPRPLALLSGTFVGLTCYTASQTLLSRRTPSLLRCDASPFSTSASASDKLDRYQRDAAAPVVGRGGRLNPRAVRQVSAGSIAGLLGGLVVSWFSKPLAVLFGLLVLGAQALESRGIRVVPYGRLQRLFRDTDVRSAVQDNVAFKLCFGATFVLAAFAEF